MLELTQEDKQRLLDDLWHHGNIRIMMDTLGATGNFLSTLSSYMQNRRNNAKNLCDEIATLFITLEELVYIVGEENVKTSFNQTIQFLPREK